MTRNEAVNKPTAVDVIKDIRQYVDIMYTQKGGDELGWPKYAVLLKGVLDIIDNKYDDVKVVKIGEMRGITLDTGPGGILHVNGIVKDIR